MAPSSTTTLQPTPICISPPCGLMPLGVCGNGVLEKGEVCDGTLGCNMSKHEMCENCTKCVQMPYCGDGKCETWENQIDNSSQIFGCIGNDLVRPSGGGRFYTRKMCSKDCGCPINCTFWNDTKKNCVVYPNDGCCAPIESDCRDCGCEPADPNVTARYECRPVIPGIPSAGYACMMPADEICGNGRCFKCHDLRNSGVK